MEKSDCADARKNLVERRNDLIKSLSHSFGGAEQMEAHIDLIVRIQNVVEVIDRVAAEGTSTQ
ncbi:MAG: hypothetical protein P4L80_01315 [Xanthobacteraceae bacterium]|nr:hypothetical protein [Xanthobacteraceae bacterium]